MTVKIVAVNLTNVHICCWLILDIQLKKLIIINSIKIESRGQKGDLSCPKMTAETNRMKKDSSPCLGRVQPMGDSPDRNNFEGSKPHQDPKIASLQGNILRLTEANK